VSIQNGPEVKNTNTRLGTWEWDVQRRRPS